ncbi:MAG: AAA family ATPase [Planctomycetaceae bacterium]|nr:AAA family ATPase [Planctomycetaceae bacterium]
MTTGLALGKFAPLHKGHQLLIETSLRENDHTIVVIYNSPDVTAIPLPVRAGWIRTLYPQVAGKEAWDGPMEVGNTPEIRRMHENYLLNLLQGENITAFYSSEFYGDHISRAFGATDRRIDPDRIQVPVSATAIRKHFRNHSQFLDPVVYRDLITRVVFLGAPSTGKTTLARELATVHKTVWMPEYGREYWDKHQSNRRLNMEQLVEIAEGHCEREEALILQADQTIFIDTDATTTYMFSLYYHGQAHPRLTELAAETRARYDLFFLCETDIPYDETWDRSGDVQRQLFQQQIKADLVMRKVPFISLKGTLSERMQTVNHVLQNFNRYQSIAEHLRMI